MSKAVRAILFGVVSLGGKYTEGALIAVAGFATGNLYLAGAGLSMVLNAAAEALKANRKAPIAGISINYAGTLEPRRLIYGALHSTESGSEDCMDQVLAGVDAEAGKKAM